MNKDLDINEMITLYWSNLPRVNIIHPKRTDVYTQIINCLDTFLPDDLQLLIPLVANAGNPITKPNLAYARQEHSKGLSAIRRAEADKNFQKRHAEALDKETQEMYKAAVPFPDRFKGFADKLRETSG
jgi:hypothetical protein